MDIHPDFHQIVDAHAFELTVKLRFKPGNVLVIRFQRLPVAGDGFVVDAYLLLQHVPAFGHTCKQV